MKQNARFRPAYEWGSTQATRIRNGLRLSRPEMIGLVCTLVLIAAVAAMFATVAQDVLAQDGLARHDLSNLQTVATHRSDSLVSIARVATNLGAVGLLIPLSVLAGLFFWFRGARSIVAVAPGLSLALAMSFVSITKQWVGRARPAAPLRLISEGGWSFPSGHSTDGAAFFLTFGLLLAIVVFRRPVIRVLIVTSAALTACGIGANRLVLGVHWPTDVLAGLALGTLVALVVTTAALLMSRQVPPPPPGP